MGVYPGKYKPGIGPIIREKTFSIAVCREINEFSGLDGPTKDLESLLQQDPEILLEEMERIDININNIYIFIHKQDGTDHKLYKWDHKEECWNLIKDVLNT
jgi:hypothetical protein